KIDNGNFWGWQAQHDGWGSGWLDKNNFATQSGDRSHIDVWNASWYGLRKVSIGLANMDKMTDATAEERNLIKGQLLFFRAWFHHRVIEYFGGDRKSTRLNSSHVKISYAVFCLKKTMKRETKLSKRLSAKTL